MVWLNAHGLKKFKMSFFKVGRNLKHRVRPAVKTNKQLDVKISEMTSSKLSVYYTNFSSETNIVQVWSVLWTEFWKSPSVTFPNFCAKVTNSQFIRQQVMFDKILKLHAFM
jgi:hypothetical protein